MKKMDFDMHRGWELLGIVLCLTGIAVAIGMNFSCRSLWCDEAMLVWNIDTRSLGALAARPLELNQTAPLLYTYILKLLTLVFGRAEWVYRLPSLLAYAVLPVAVWWTAKKLFAVVHPWLCAGFCANLGVLLMYSNQAKPYMLEAVLVLAVLAVHYLYLTGKLKWWWRAVAWILLGMSGNPAWFAVAGCLALESIHGLLAKDRQALSGCIGTACLWGAVMAGYYLAWLAPAAKADAMQTYWQESMLPWPVTLGAMRDFFRALRTNFFLAEFGKREWAMIPLMGISLVQTMKMGEPLGPDCLASLGSGCLRFLSPHVSRDHALVGVCRAAVRHVGIPGRRMDGGQTAAGMGRCVSGSPRHRQSRHPALLES